MSSLSLLYVARQLAVVFGRTSARIFIILSSTQFHLMYYAGRTLPNFLALPFGQCSFRRASPITSLTRVIDLAVNISLGLLLASRDGPALMVLTAAAAIVRSELALLLAPVVALLLGSRRITVVKALTYGAIGGFGGMGESISTLAVFGRVLTRGVGMTLFSCDSCGRLDILVTAVPVARTVHHLL